MDALQNNDEKTHLIKRTSTEAKLMGFASVFMCARQEQQLSGERPPVSYTHLRAHETRHDLVCRLLLEK